jgi:hypothetical protein
MIHTVFQTDMEKVDYAEYLPKVEEAKVFVAYLWLHLVCLMLMCEVIRMSAYLNPFASTSKFCNSFSLFVSKNVREDGVNRKTIRFFDTLGKFTSQTLNQSYVLYKQMSITGF